MENTFKEFTPLEALPAGAKCEAPLDMHDVCEAIVENAVEFLEKNYGDEVLEQITDMVALSIQYGDGSSAASVVRRFDKSTKN